MNRLAAFLILMIFAAFSIACRSQLPPEAPNDLEMRFESSVLYPDGVPADFFRTIKISGNQLVYAHSRCDAVDTVTLNEATVKYLYQQFVKFEFDLIRSEQTPQGDGQAGFREIYLKAGDVSKSVKYGARFPLSKESAKHFNRLWSEIDTLSVRNVPNCRR